MLANVMQTKTLQTLKTRQLLPVEAVTRSWKILSIKGSTLCQGHYYGNFLLSFPLKMRLLIPLLSPHSFWKGKKYLLIYYEGLKYILAPAFVVFIFGLLCPTVSISSSLPSFVQEIVSSAIAVGHQPRATSTFSVQHNFNFKSSFLFCSMCYFPPTIF